MSIITFMDGMTVIGDVEDDDDELIITNAVVGDSPGLPGGRPMPPALARRMHGEPGLELSGEDEVLRIPKANVRFYTSS